MTVTKSTKRAAMGAAMGAIVASGMLGMGAIAPAQAAVAPSLTINSITAEFLNPTPLGVNIDNSGATKSVRWGWGTTEAGQSGYDFTAESIGPSGLEVSANGTAFGLGTFKHLNYPVTTYFDNPFLKSIDLQITFNIEGFGYIVSTYLFAHKETPNSGTCPDGSVSTCDDIVTVTKNPSGTKSVTIDDTTYYLAIAGFQVDGETFTDWLTQENATNTATLQATLTSTVVPLPAAVWFMLTAIGGLFGTRWLRRDKAATARA